MRTCYNVAISQAIIVYFGVVVLTLVAIPPVWGQGLEGLSRGHRVLIERGLQLEATAHPDVTGNFDPARWAESNFTTALFTAASMTPFDATGYPSAPGIPWSKIQYNVHSSLLFPSEVPYAPTLIRNQLGDEQDLTVQANLDQAKDDFDRFHLEYPDVMMSTSQNAIKFSDAEMLNYMQYTGPDLLMSHRYDMTGADVGGSRTNFYTGLERYRDLSLLGNDGTGTEPIPFGFYIGTYYFPANPGPNPYYSESQLRVKSFAPWAFGAKLLNSYVYEYRDSEHTFDTIFFDTPGTSSPTPQFYYAAETNRQSLNLGPTLVHLISTDVRMNIGQHLDGTPVDNDMPVGVPSWDSSADPYITSISATNLGSKNDGLRGDVIVGYYEPLLESFDGPDYEDEKYFMIVNGLTDVDGSAAETVQSIRVDFDFAGTEITSLERLSRDTGLVEEVPLINDSGSLFHLDLTLDGGTGDLFKFNTGASFVGIEDPIRPEITLVDNGCPEAGLHSYTITATGPGITTLSEFTIDGEVHQVFDGGTPSEWLGDGSASELETTDSHVIFGDIRFADLGGGEWDWVNYPEGPPLKVTEETITGGGDIGMGTLNNYDDSVVAIHDSYSKFGAPGGEDTVELIQVVVADGDGFSGAMTIVTSTDFDPVTNESTITTHEGLTFSLPALTAGDANGDGFVDATDVSLLAQHWLQGSGACWADGDFNGDGAVNDIDATILAANWQSQTTVVPEPGMLVLLAGMLLGLLRRKTTLPHGVRK